MNISPTAFIAAIRLNLQRRPLWPICTVEDILDIFQPKLTAMIEAGKIPWAWDLGTGRSRKEIRVLAHSVVERTAGTMPAIGETRNLHLPEVMGLILPKTRETLRGVELQRLFHASPGLICDLSASKEIKKAAETLPQTGPNASPRFTRHSVAQFLEKRRIN